MWNSVLPNTVIKQIITKMNSSPPGWTVDDVTHIKWPKIKEGTWWGNLYEQRRDSPASIMDTWRSFHDTIEDFAIAKQKTEPVPLSEYLLKEDDDSG